MYRTAVSDGFPGPPGLFSEIKANTNATSHEIFHYAGAKLGMWLKGSLK